MHEGKGVFKLNRLKGVFASFFVSHRKNFRSDVKKSFCGTKCSAGSRGSSIERNHFHLVQKFE